MSGLLRIQYPDTWYHVGNRGEGIFSLRKDINFFNCLPTLIIKNSGLRGFESQPDGDP